MLKVSLHFKKFTNFTDKTIFKVLFLYEHKHLQRFSNLYQCTLKVRLSFLLLYNRFHQLATFVIVVNVCKLNPLSANPPKMVKHTQTIRRQFADELFECV